MLPFYGSYAKETPLYQAIDPTPVFKTLETLSEEGLFTVKFLAKQKSTLFSLHQLERYLDRFETETLIEILKELNESHLIVFSEENQTILMYAPVKKVILQFFSDEKSSMRFSLSIQNKGFNYPDCV